MNRWSASRRTANRQTFLIALAITVALAALVAVVAWQWGGSDQSTMELSGAEAPVPEENLAPEKAWTADLYFPGGGRLYAEAHELPPVTEPAQRIAAVVAALLAGPDDSGLVAPLPEGVQLRKVYLTEDGAAFLDLESPEGSPPPASGSLREMLTVYSLVNTVLRNCEQADRVVLLWNGRQLKTFAGHVDTMRPLSADNGLIAAR